MNILMVAAENDALEGAKVGGIADVVRDIAPALAVRGHQIHVVVPGYHSLSDQAGSQLIGSFQVSFASNSESIALYQVPGRSAVSGVTQWVLQHHLFAAEGRGRVYHDDPPDRPFATDATKFALFCTAVAEAIKLNFFNSLDVIHLHDWHASCVALLRAYHSRYLSLGSIRLVYSIHNLALQGIRPFDGDISAVHAWFPGISIDYDQVRDPRYADCINLMRVGINLSDAVHAVSPTYVKEITRPSNHALGFFGGEGLESDLLRAEAHGRLSGILNGAEYPSVEASEMLYGHDNTREALLLEIEDSLLSWVAKSPSVYPGHTLALGRIAQWLRTLSNKEMLLTSVGRLTDQKVLLLRQAMADGLSLLDHLLLKMKGRGRLILLGSGDAKLEHFLLDVAGRHSHFLFLRGFSIDMSQSLYHAGDLFLMPSSFEPCGISQMLAMRAGQPCLVHAVGGLADTVEDGITGFSFTGNSLSSQCDALLETAERAFTKFNEPVQWQTISENASSKRFLWSEAAARYELELYA